MVKAKFHRPELYRGLLARLRGPRHFIQVLAGPRQAGKTTVALQVLAALEGPSHYASADEPALKDRSWIEAQWERVRVLSSTGRRRGALLVLDEIQKIPGWSELAKRLWDEDSRSGRPVKVLVLGSAPFLMQRGLTESLAGRFEILPVTHWSFADMRSAFGWDLDRYLFFGAYPGVARLAKSQKRWRSSVEVFYWRDRGKEVDFVLRRGRRLVAIEVKSGSRHGALSGLFAFGKAYPSARKLLVGGDGIPLDEFLLTPIDQWFNK